MGLAGLRLPLLRFFDRQLLTGKGIFARFGDGWGSCVARHSSNGRAWWQKSLETLLKKNKIVGKKTNVWLVCMFFRVSAPCSLKAWWDEDTETKVHAWVHWEKSRFFSLHLLQSPLNSKVKERCAMAFAALGFGLDNGWFRRRALHGCPTATLLDRSHCLCFRSWN